MDREYMLLFANTYGLSADIMPNEYMFESEHFSVKRTWLQRLFTFPWNPFKKYETQIRQIPAKTFLKLRDGTFVGHPIRIEQYNQFKALEFLS